MNDPNIEAFASVYKEAFQKCFGFSLQKVLSETESKHFGNKIFEATGLVIGAKSLRNYSAYIIDNTVAKSENPSVATLDTLARYVLSAPYTDEIQRKNKESHHPYWYQYKNNFANTVIKKPPQKKHKTSAFIFSVIVILVLIITLFIYQPFQTTNKKSFTDHFVSVDEDSLRMNGWSLRSEDTTWWNRRSEKGPGITLFTLSGDNWTDSTNSPNIKNLLVREITSGCFTAEIQLDNFIPLHNWQQAGILLMEDSAFKGKTIRLSIAYNDFFGGYSKPKEIIIQCISSEEKDFSKPEEIAHIPLFTFGAAPDTLLNKNLQYAALRIEKNNDHFRFLYSTSPVKNYAFKEAFSKDLPIKPKYIGIFALQGFVNNSNYMPAHITLFNLSDLTCEK